MRFDFIRQHAGQFHVRPMCRALGVSPSGYYAWRKRPASPRSREDRRLQTTIRSIHQESRKTYGSPRIHAELKSRGERVSRKRVARLMQQEGIRSRRVRKFRVTTRSNHSHPVAANILDRNFEVDGLNRVWLSDITYISTEEGWLYLAAVEDLCSRRVVGWATRNWLHGELTVAALEMAIERRCPEVGLLHHSDRGSQYAAREYQSRLAQNGIEVSMSRKGDCWDNAPMESFMATLKTELVHHHRWPTRARARSAIFEYIEVFYNTKRSHSSLGYRTPLGFEQELARRARRPDKPHVQKTRENGSHAAGSV